MSYHVPDSDILTTTLVEWIARHCGSPVGDATAPHSGDDVANVADPPYAILYPVNGGDLYGPPMGFRAADATFEYQVTTVGLRRDHTQWLGNRIREVIIGQAEDFSFRYPLIVPGMVVMDRVLSGPPGGVAPEGKLFNMVESYFIKVSAA